ncbi:DNA-binding HxlR family transcriptional regulator [Chitinophaga dinghuensis]|uniref:DNA-binding HxlR family transcriptional regulator n=1 Tax=Chitinophaga dinghuensis TaxID=1539050 RepID=A0A327VMA8_9BACT|nr:helix-turn-helix domain-containing protein [Chitinophaga dinghuensis]RAJ75652.1 DNA-binding HxlR family transcriptional regulator [Chitinophaga dinghuensis]
MGTRKENSTYSRNEKYIINCNMSYAVHVIGGRWKLLLLDKLRKGTSRYSDLKKEFSYISERMLTLQLKSMEEDGLIIRNVYAEVPVRVEYTLTPAAIELIPILDLLSAWGNRQRSLQE